MGEGHGKKKVGPLRFSGRQPLRVTTTSPVVIDKDQYARTARLCPELACEMLRFFFNLFRPGNSLYFSSAQQKRNPRFTAGFLHLLNENEAHFTSYSASITSSGPFLAPSPPAAPGWAPSARASVAVAPPSAPGAAPVAL